MVVFIADEENTFTHNQHFLINENYYSSALIQLHDHSFSLKGILNKVPLEQFTQLCERVSLALSELSETFLAESPILSAPIYNKDKELVEKACRYIEQNLALALTVESISKAMSTNRNTLSKAFKSELNTGVSTWLRLTRMERAWQLLVGSNISIQDISAQLGYPSQSNFSTAFKSLFKLSPIQVRRNFHKM